MSNATALRDLAKHLVPQPLEHLKPGLCELLAAHLYAADAGRSSWDFAVEIRALRNAGLTASDLRWLVCKDYARHAREVTRHGDSTRSFQPTGELTFVKRSCFILTAAGVTFVRGLLDVFEVDDSHAPTVPFPRVAAQPGTAPTWDPQRHELRVGNRIVKRYRWPAANQETLLMAFQEEHWPPRIDDPLPPQPDQDPKRRLHDTIKCLNRCQTNRLIRFRGDGTGEGVLWEFVDDEKAPRQAGAE